MNSIIHTENKWKYVIKNSISALHYESPFIKVNQKAIPIDLQFICLPVCVYVMQNVAMKFVFIVF